MTSIVTTSEAETRAVGRKLASLLRPDDMLLLSGELGSGKTVLVSGLAEGLGIDEEITSPTFVIMRRYDDGFIPLVHADVYRLGSLNELIDLDVLDEARGAALVIEWGDAVASAIPGDYLRVHLAVDEEGRRTIDMDPVGPAWMGRSFEDVAP